MIRVCAWCKPCSASFCDCGSCENTECEICNKTTERVKTEPLPIVTGKSFKQFKEDETMNKAKLISRSLMSVDRSLMLLAAMYAYSHDYKPVFWYCVVDVVLSMLFAKQIIDLNAKDVQELEKERAEPS